MCHYVREIALTELEAAAEAEQSTEDPERELAAPPADD